MSHEDQFLKSLRATFKVEANEHLQAIAATLLSLEKTDAAEEKQPLIETMFRSAHSLKGAARAVNFVEIESLCQSLEDLFAAWKRSESTASSSALDVVHQALDAVSRMIDAPEGQSDPALSLRARELRNLSVSGPRVEEARGGTLPKVQPPTALPAETEKPLIAETVRIGVAKLDARLLQAEEMLAAKLLTSEREFELRELAERLAEWKKEWLKAQPLVRVVKQSLERSALMNGITSAHELQGLIEFLDWNQNYLRLLESKVTTLTRTATQDNLFVGKLVDDLVEDSKSLLMLPLSTLSAFLQRLVRDLCRDQGKQAELVIIGEEVEIDKRVLEAMKDPLIHIFRNCVDHGLETPEERRQQGKAPRATITLTVTPLNGDKVELVVTDDGAGIDREKVKASAVKNGVISKAEASRISDEEALTLVFRADVSTSPMITELSGRGLGLAIVREQAERLGGVVQVESSRRSGTTIRITLPITLRTFRGILVKASNQSFVIPTAQVIRVARFRIEDVKTIEGRQILVFDGRAVSLAELAAILELPRSEPHSEKLAATPVVILGIADEQIALAVDAVLGEQEVLVKRFVKPLSRVRNIAGATVLGSGEVTPILNVTDLLKSAKRISGAATILESATKPTDQPKSILLVEDSITSRMLLKGILESAGYQVKTAVDGVDAFTLLRTETFDLVVSDVEMPRLNGFGLTARIRADKKLEDLPVVLVTALERREDRERGVDVGASAYLVKSSFDQSNLLEAVRRLA